MNVRALIIDDELPSIQALTTDLARYCPQVDVLDYTQVPERGAELLQKLKPDLLFLDITMPGMSGTDFVRYHALPPTCRVIFVTAYTDFALEAFQLHVADYLVKPVVPQELIRAVHKVQRDLELVQKLDWLEKSATLRPLDRLIIPVGHGYEFICPEDILYLEADGNYTYIFLTEQRRLHVTRQLHQFVEQLPSEKFFRCHQSYLVNMAHVHKYYQGDGGELVMDNKQAIPVSRQNKKELLQVIRSAT